MSNVRAKFTVTSKVETHSANPYGTSNATQFSVEVRLTPVSGEENKTWNKWTPSGSITMTINNPDAYNAFKLGQAYFVDFTEAPAKEADEK
jgi:hypothetical protein